MRTLLFFVIFITSVLCACQTTSQIYALPSLSTLRIENRLGEVSICITNENGIDVELEKDENIDIETNISGDAMTIIASLLEEKENGGQLARISLLFVLVMLGISVERKYWFFLMVPLVLSATCANISVKIPSNIKVDRIIVNDTPLDVSKIQNCMAGTISIPRDTDSHQSSVSSSVTASRSTTGATSIATTGNPTTAVATTAMATTAVATTGVATTGNPTTGVATTRAATTGVATTGNPTTGVPTTGNPTTAVATTGNPTTGVPTTGNPTTGVPTTGNPTTGVPTTGVPTTGVPTTGVATTRAATTGVATTGNPTTGVPTTGVATTRAATTGVVTTGNPTTGVATTGVVANDGPRIAFRLTQIQDFWMDNTNMAVMNIFAAKNASLTLGVIGGIFGGEQPFVAQVRSALINPNWDVEVAANGWKYEDFGTISHEKRVEFIGNATLRLQRIFGVSVKSFILPWGSPNADTISLLTTAGYTVVSGSSDTGQTLSSGQSFYRFPATATMYNPNTPTQLQTQTVIINSIQTALNNYGFAVVDIDPTAFDLTPANPSNSPNPTALTLMTNVLNACLTMTHNNRQVSLVTLQGIINPKVNKQVPSYTAFGTGRVAWRLDDVCDEYLAPAQIAVMNVFKEENIPLTAGIITNSYGKVNTYNMTGYISQRLLTDPNFELACHGYLHEDFSLITLAVQTTHLKNCVDILKAKHNFHCEIFMPPFNALNANTLTALHTNNYTMLSSEVSQDTPPYFHADPLLWKFPIGAQTADFDSNGLYKITAATNTMSQIRQQLLAYGYSAVMLHPQEYTRYINSTTFDPNQTVNSTAIDELRTLLRLAKTAGFTNTNLGQLADYEWSY